ncbi:hypothetical protein AO392_14415 [Pseudomonas putida]|nr:hypothetical protein AO392_14415 [Pseudomonas putida]
MIPHSLIGVIILYRIMVKSISRHRVRQCLLKLQCEPLNVLYNAAMIHTEVVKKLYIPIARHAQ